MIIKNKEVLRNISKELDLEHSKKRDKITKKQIQQGCGMKEVWADDDDLYMCGEGKLNGKLLLCPTCQAQLEMIEGFEKEIVGFLGKLQSEFNIQGETISWETDVDNWEEIKEEIKQRING